MEDMTLGAVGMVLLAEATVAVGVEVENERAVGLEQLREDAGRTDSV